MIKKILTAILIYPLFLFGQNTADKTLLDEVQSLNQKLNSQNAKIKAMELHQQLFELRANRIFDSLEIKINNNIEIQAQNERALNIALDEFSKKFEEQNKTVADVKAALDKQWDQQLIFYGLGVCLFVIILIVSVRVSNKKVLAQQQKTWNEFNEYIIKR